MLWHTLRVESKRAEQLEGKMQSTVLEMSCTLAAQNATWVPHHILKVLLFYFLFLPPDFATCACWKVTAEAGHTAVSTTSPPAAFCCIYPTIISLPERLPSPPPSV